MGEPLKSSRKYQLLITSLFTFTFLGFQNCSGPGAGVGIREINDTFSSINTDGENPGIDPGLNPGDGTSGGSGTPVIIGDSPSTEPPGSGGASGSPGSSPPSPSSDSKFIESSTTKVVEAKLPVDVLFVVDNSGSMATEQSNMALRFGSFLNQLSGLDWQVGIVTTDVTTPYPESDTTDGKLLAFDQMGLKVLNSEMPLDLANSLFASTIQRKEKGSSEERGIRAVYRALERAFISTSAKDESHRVLFRKGAALSVVVISDADETVSEFEVDISKDSPYNLYRYVTNDLHKQFSFNSIIVKPNDLYCYKLLKPGTNKRENEDYGYNYARLTELSGGILGSVCERDYATQLSQMGQGVQVLVNSIELNCVPQDKDGDSLIDINVVSNGQPVTQFTVNGSRVEFPQALAEGSTTVNYFCAQ